MLAMPTGTKKVWQWEAKPKSYFKTHKLLLNSWRSLPFLFLAPPHLSEGHGSLVEKHFEPFKWTGFSSSRSFCTLWPVWALIDSGVDLNFSKVNLCSKLISNRSFVLKAGGSFRPSPVLAVGSKTRPATPDSVGSFFFIPWCQQACWKKKAERPFFFCAFPAAGWIRLTARPVLGFLKCFPGWTARSVAHQGTPFFAPPLDNATASGPLCDYAHPFTSSFSKNKGRTCL